MRAFVPTLPPPHMVSCVFLLLIIIFLYKYLRTTARQLRGDELRIGGQGEHECYHSLHCTDYLHGEWLTMGHDRGILGRMGHYPGE